MHEPDSTQIAASPNGPVRDTSHVAELLPESVPRRLELALEVHARPSPSVEPPACMTHLVLLVAPELRQEELDHLNKLAVVWGVSPPTIGAAYFSAQHEALSLRWERHGEFSSYTLIQAGPSPNAFADPPIQRLEPGWLRAIPGDTLYAANAILIASDELLSTVQLKCYFGEQIPVGARIGGGAGLAYTDFWIHEDGFARFVLVSQSLTPRQAGRMLGRLFDTETYRMLALLAFPVAKELSGRLASWEQSLANLAARISGQEGDDEAIMQSLTHLAAEVESTLARIDSRFGASRAYHDLVTRRIAELREERIQGLQTIDEFMSRRLSPAIATIASAERRLHGLSERVGQVSTLLSTRVDIARESQNQELLVALNRRAEVQFHLQRAVEVLSIAAIIYYGAGLVGYLAKAAKTVGLHVDVDLLIGISIPILAVISFLAVHIAHRRITRLEFHPTRQGGER